jgi:histidyl-tRNA synthetase
MATIAEMELLFTYLEAFGVLDRISFDFSLARGLDYYTGLIYEAVLTDTDRVGSIAGGGRYDGLVGMFSGKPVPSVGVSVGIERVFSILEERAATSVRATTTQIMVAQASKGLTAERMKILGEFWKADIAAETLYADNPKAAKQVQFALDNGIPLILWIGEDEVAQGVVNVKSLNHHEQYVIKREELVDRVRELIAANPVLLTQE